MQSRLKKSMLPKANKLLAKAIDTHGVNDSQWDESHFEKLLKQSLLIMAVDNSSGEIKFFALQSDDNNTTLVCFLDMKKAKLRAPNLRLLAIDPQEVLKIFLRNPFDDLLISGIKCNLILSDDRVKEILEKWAD
jgi:hypothetical protein